ncbi:hypothetical protein ABZT03_44020 [Streptomyces sp. NPDC005574]|uniref:hypothetical protein n=1 Tax=Streptomyces sp. NPDC005574 TaxID=3156891 RepID=UPI0033ABE224
MQVLTQTMAPSFSIDCTTWPMDGAPLAYNAILHTLANRGGLAMNDDWIPLSMRCQDLDVLPLIVLADNRTVLREWIEDSLHRCAVDTEEVLRRTCLTVDYERSPAEVDEQFYLGAYSPPEKLSDIIDAILDLLPTSHITLPGTCLPQVEYLIRISAEYRDSLPAILDACNSPYGVRHDGRGLIIPSSIKNPLEN